MGGGLIGGLTVLVDNTQQSSVATWCGVFRNVGKTSLMVRYNNSDDFLDDNQNDEVESFGTSLNVDGKVVEMTVICSDKFPAEQAEEMV